MEELFLAFFDTHRIDIKQSKFLLACSGGRDSMALAHLMSLYHFNFSIAHINHGTREGQSDEDAAFVRNFCKENDIEFFLFEFDLHTVAEAEKGSTQMVARDIRYEFLNEVKEEHWFDYIVTAHHQQDQIETFFINLGRAAGINGLTSIPSRNQHVIRPLIKINGQQIDAFVSRYNIEHVVDVSNFESDYERNQWRNEVLPFILAQKPNYFKSVSKSIEYLNEANHFMHEILLLWRKKYVVKKPFGISVQAKGLINQSSGSFILYQMLSPYGFNRNQVNDVYFSTQNGSKIESHQYVVFKERDTYECCALSYLQEENDSIKLVRGLEVDGIGRFEIMTRPLEIDKQFQLEIPANWLKTAEFELRKWRPGDSFKPNGMNGQAKKLKKYFVDEKYTTIEKQKQWLLCHGKTILWVLGKRKAQINTGKRKAYIGFMPLDVQ